MPSIKMEMVTMLQVGDLIVFRCTEDARSSGEVIPETIKITGLLTRGGHEVVEFQKFLNDQATYCLPGDEFQRYLEDRKRAYFSAAPASVCNSMRVELITAYRKGGTGV